MTEHIAHIAQVVGWLATISAAAFALHRGCRQAWRIIRPRLPYHRMNDRIERLAGKLHMLINLRGDAIYVCRPDGFNVWVSDALARMFHSTPEAMRGNGWASSIVHTDQQRSVNRWLEAVRTRSPYRDEYRLSTGEHIRTEAFAHINETGELIFYIGYAVTLPGGGFDNAKPMS